MVCEDYGPPAFTFIRIADVSCVDRRHSEKYALQAPQSLLNLEHIDLILGALFPDTLIDHWLLQPSIDISLYILFSGIPVAEIFEAMCTLMLL